MRSYLVVLVTAAALTVVVTSLASWLLDPYGIGHALSGRLLLQPNDRASKTAFLAKNCNRFDSYIMGNSRTLILSGRELAGEAGDRYYNLGVPAEEIGQSLKRLEFLLRVGCPVSRLLVSESIEILAYPNPASLQDMEHPLIGGGNLFSFYGKYFLGPQGAIAYVRSRLNPTTRPMFYYSDGHMDSLWDMKSDAEYQLPICVTSRLSARDKEELFARLPIYRKFAALTDEHHVKVVVWLTPLSKSRSVALDDPDVERYIEELRRIPGLSVFEANRNSPLLSDFHQWHDCSHFHRAVFDQLVAPGVGRLLHE
jgi:hypothetical protein